MNNYLWWPKPKKEDEIDPYLDKILKFTGDNLWTKIIRACAHEELSQEIKQGPESESELKP